jgi:hypothetical protein
MKNVVSAIFVTCAVSLAVGVTAQEQSAPGSQPGVRTQQPATGGQTSPDTQTPSTATRRQADEKVTISGCIQNAPAPEAGATASAAGGSKYMLGNAKMASAASRSTSVGTSGTTAATRYRLQGDDKTISPHLNHQVEITGTIQNASASAIGAAAGSAAAGPTLKVDSVKMISATCQ